jgi:hypothetical protein
MIVNMIVHKWDDVTLEQVGNYRLPFPSTFVAPGGGSMGFLEVFDTRLNAVNAGCNPANLVEVKEKV